MARPKPRIEMPNQFDFAAYSPARELVMLIEVKWSKDSSEEDAIFFRKNLRGNRILSDGPHFMLAYRNRLFLWKGSSAPDAKPDYASPAKPILKEYLGERTDAENEVGPETLEQAYKLWLIDLIRGSKVPDPKSDADNILVDSGVYARIKGGEIRRGFLE